MWQLPPGSVRLIISRGRHAKLLEWANEAQLVVQPPPPRGEPATQIDTIEIGAPPISVKHRCAALAITGKEAELDSSYELVLLTLLTIFELCSGGA